MSKPVFAPHRFTPTEWNSSEDKAKFAHDFMRFIGKGYKETTFTRTFYNRLSMSFGHIAHYDRHTFYQTWFATSAKRLSFLKHALRHPCYGSPAFTYSDVERALQIEIRQSGLIEYYERVVDVETRASDLAQLERLQRKFALRETSFEAPGIEAPKPVMSVPAPALPAHSLQARLF